MIRYHFCGNFSFMTNPTLGESTNISVATGEAAVTDEIRLSREWLHAFDPAIFLPKLWGSDRTSKARIPWTRRV